MSSDAKALFAKRRSEGWGVDPRTEANLISSQAMTFNLFGPLVSDLGLATGIMRQLLPAAGIRHVEAIDIEWAPRRRSTYLNDSTRIDALVRVRTDTRVSAVALEVKYTDRFNSRVVPLTSRYSDLNRVAKLWQDEEVALATRSTNQLARIHALATADAIRAQKGGIAALVVIRHELDVGAARLCSAYREHLSSGQHMVDVSHGQFLSMWSSHEFQAAALKLRYVQ